MPHGPIAFPFDPAAYAGDLRMVHEDGHAACYFFDTCCSGQTPEERMVIDTKLVRDWQAMRAGHDAEAAAPEQAGKDACAE